MLVAQDQNFLPDKVAIANAVVHEDQRTQSHGCDQWWLIGLQQEKERIRQLLRDPSIIQRLQWLSRQPQRETEQLRRLHFGEECFRAMARKQQGEHERYLRDVDQMRREILAAIEKDVRVKTELVPHRPIIGVAESAQRPRRGPARCTVDRFRVSDWSLYPEIERMIHEGRMTVHAAAIKLAHEGKVQGVGGSEPKNRAMRLANRFRKERSTTDHRR